MDLTNLAEFYDKEAANYDNKRWSTNAGKFINDSQIKIFKYLSSEIKNKNVLEVGAGTGRFTSILLDQDNKVTAIDISPLMIKKLLYNLKDHQKYLNLRTIISDARKMTLNSSSIDYVISINAISHIPDFLKLINEVYRVLKPGGTFIFNFPNYRSFYFPFAFLINYRQKSLLRNVFTKWYNMQDIINIISKRFIIIKFLGQFHIPTLTPKIFIPIAKIINLKINNSKYKELAPIIFIKAMKPYESN